MAHDDREPLHKRLRKLAVMIEHGTEVAEDVKDVLRKSKTLLGIKLATRLHKARTDLDREEAE